MEGPASTAGPLLPLDSVGRASDRDLRLASGRDRRLRGLDGLEVSSSPQRKPTIGSVIGVLTIIGVLLGGIRWAYSIESNVAQLVHDIDPMVSVQLEHERRIIVMEERISEWSDIRTRLGDLEKQMARQTAILEQLLVRLEGR